MRMSHQARLLIVLVSVSMLTGCTTMEPMPTVRQIPAPALVPGVIAEMNTPGHWIGRHPDPDRLVMTADQIAAFNGQTERAGLGVASIADFNDTVDGEKLKADLDACLRSVAGRGYCFADGRQPDNTWWQDLRDNMDLGAIAPEVNVRFGLIVGFCDHRVLPAAEGLYNADLNLSFDRLQDSTLDVASPVAVLHRSRDARWLYVVGQTLRGWVQAESVALCERDVVRVHVRSGQFAVVTAAKADLYADEDLRNHLGRVQMGTRLVVAQDMDGDKLRVLTPRRDTDGVCTLEAAYVRKTEVSLGYLPYTARTIIQQAFKLLNTPYGWGGLFGEQDCSRFVQEVFATVGLVLPRNSSEQAKVGRQVHASPGIGLAQEKLAVLRGRAAPALTLLCMKGHGMLFLGFVEGRPYVVHDLWSYDVDASTVAVVNRVAVTPLDLGSGPAGSLLDRVDNIRVLDAVPGAHEALH
ncbi:MAG TPA: SH3 domain-containing protein [Sedimentisphaerales bacterium]|nr:SH3 domain-containing protein [Sedimentisphaerales bacterium]HNU28970.1 SH3 domain-containing protein [Sedimentisphaerales bacterium]